MNRAMRRKQMIEQLERKLNTTKPIVLSEEQKELLEEYKELIRIEMHNGILDEESEDKEYIDIDIKAEYQRLYEKSLKVFEEA